MKRISSVLTALSLAVLFALPAFAASPVSPDTGDVAVYVLIALVVAACAIIGTIIYSKKKK